jgi:hypothetical protein
MRYLKLNYELFDIEALAWLQALAGLPFGS